MYRRPYWRRRMGPPPMGPMGPMMGPHRWVRPWGCGCFTLMLGLAVVMLGVFSIFSWFHF